MAIAVPGRNGDLAEARNAIGLSKPSIVPHLLKHMVMTI